VPVTGQVWGPTRLQARDLSAADPANIPRQVSDLHRRRRSGDARPCLSLPVSPRPTAWMHVQKSCLRLLRVQTCRCPRVAPSGGASSPEAPRHAAPRSARKLATGSMDAHTPSARSMRTANALGARNGLSTSPRQGERLLADGRMSAF
jgi:hypothetical protein